MSFGRCQGLTISLQEFFTNSLNSFDEDQDVEGALQYLELQDLQHRYKDLSVTLMPHVSPGSADR